MSGPGLFHKAILMSGALQPAVSKDEHDRTVTQQVGSQAGRGRDTSALGPARFISFLVWWRFPHPCVLLELAH